MRRLAVFIAACWLLVVWSAAAASAAAPNKDGWWNETNVGLGFSAAPPEVPSGGLYIQNGFSGPVAISALTFTVPAGHTAGSLTLEVTGNPVITSPPIACPLTAAGRNYKPAQDGVWADRPAYDCSAKVTATVARGNSSVSFAAGSLLRDGTVAIAVLAGGAADQIAFDPPGPNSLAVTAAGTSTAAAPPAPAASGAPAPAGSPVGIPATSPTPPAASVASPPAATGASSPPDATFGALPSSGSSPAAAPATAPNESGAPASSSGAVPASQTGHGTGSSSSGTGLGRVLAIVGLLGLLVAYSEGFGLLGGRIRPFRRPARQ